MILVRCESCGKTVKAPDEYAGKKCKCPKCREILTVPVTQSVGTAEKSEPVPDRAPRPAEPHPDSRPATPVIPKVIPSQHTETPAPVRTRAVHRNPVSKGTIKYECADCGTPLESEGNLAGKQDTCPSCGKAVVVPLQSTTGTAAFFRKIPKSVYIGSTIVVLVAIVSLSLWIVLRDTWESDHSAEIRQMSETTISLIHDKKNEEGVSKYEAMLALVGDRQLQDPSLRQSMLNAKEIAEPVRKQVNEAKNLERLRVMEDQAKAFAASGEVKHAVDTYKKALNLIQQVNTGNPKFASAIQRISGAKRPLEQQLAALERQAVQKREAEKQKQEQVAREKEKLAKGHVKFGGQWMTPEEYVRAKLDTQVFLKKAQPFAQRAARISSLYRVGLSCNDFSDELQELSVAYDQAGKAPNANCHHVTTRIELYMSRAQITMKSWQLKIKSGASIESQMRINGMLPSQLLPKLCSIQRELATAISELEKKIR